MPLLLHGHSTIAAYLLTIKSRTCCCCFATSNSPATTTALYPAFSSSSVKWSPITRKNGLPSVSTDTPMVLVGLPEEPPPEVPELQLPHSPITPAAKNKILAIAEEIRSMRMSCENMTLDRSAGP